MDADLPAVALAVRLYVSDISAAAVRLVWILGHIPYFVGYTEPAESRSVRYARGRTLLRCLPDASSSL
jgi:hypothetical protein